MILDFWNSFEGLYFIHVREASLNVFNRYSIYFVLLSMNWMNLN